MALRINYNTNKKIFQIIKNRFSFKKKNIKIMCKNNIPACIPNKSNIKLPKNSLIVFLKSILGIEKPFRITHINLLESFDRSTYFMQFLFDF
jgi:hypothetical protein